MKANLYISAIIVVILSVLTLSANAQSNNKYSGEIPDRYSNGMYDISTGRLYQYNAVYAVGSYGDASGIGGGVMYQRKFMSNRFVGFNLGAEAGISRRENSGVDYTSGYGLGKVGVEFFKIPYGVARHTKESRVSLEINAVFGAEQHQSWEDYMKKRAEAASNPEKEFDPNTLPAKTNPFTYGVEASVNFQVGMWVEIKVGGSYMMGNDKVVSTLNTNDGYCRNASEGRWKGFISLGYKF